MKRCPKNHDNPDNAKFCRICGYNFDNSFGSQLKSYWNTLISLATRIFNTMINESKTRLSSMGRSSGFTPDMFPNIYLSPCSVAKVDFKIKKKSIILMLFFFSLFLILTINETKIGNVFYYKMGVPSYFAWSSVMVTSITVFIVFLCIFILFLRRLWKWLRYKINADYIEYFAFTNNLYRIAKKGKLGLFDKSKNTVTMGSHYDNITKFDREHILIEKNGKNGLFSMKKMGIIVPIRFDRIDAFKNSIVKCHKGVEQFYYDVNGNKMK